MVYQEQQLDINNKNYYNPIQPIPKVWHRCECVYTKGVNLHFIQAENTIEHAFAESFNGRPWNGCLQTN